MLKPVGATTRAVKGMGLVLACWFTSGVFAQGSLESVTVEPLPANRIAVQFKLSTVAPEPSVFALQSPPRISVDLPNTRLALENRRVTINTGPVQSITAVEAQDRSRVVISLTELGPYTVRRDGQMVIVELDAIASAATRSRPGDARPAIRDVEFRRSETGAGRLIILLADNSADVDVRNEGGKIVATFKNTQLPESLTRRLDVLDFATPVKFIDSAPDGINSRFTITPTAGAEFDQVAYQLGDQFTIELQPLTRQEQERRERSKPKYTGERLNVNFQNIEVRALLQIIADVADKNLVTSDSVSGNITLRLQNVPWDQALDLVLRTKGLSKAEDGNVLWVAPTSEVAEQAKQELEAKKQAEELAPLATEFIQVNYAKASDFTSLIQASESFLSDRGSVTVDERTNQIIARDTRDKLAEIEQLIRRLDIPVKQVLIEARIVVANDDFSKNLGFRTGFTAVSDPSKEPFFSTTGTPEGNDTIVFDDPGDPNNGVINTGTVTALPALANRLNFNLPANSDSPAGRFALAILGSDYLIDLELSALQAENEGELISSPRVVTANGKEALIEQGEEIPFTAGGTGTTPANTQFKKAVLALRVTPQITPDDRVVLDLEVSRDSRGAVVPQAGGGQAVGIDTRRVTTQLLVNNGETVVLGGIFEQTKLDLLSKVPLLGDIPLLGLLFRNTTKTDNKRELLIFVTPKILSEGVNVN